MLEHHNLDIEHDTPESHGYIHENDLPSMEDLRRQVLELAGAVYDTGRTVDIRCSLIEICYELGIAIPSGDMAIERKNLSNGLQWHLGYQRCMLDNMNKKEKNND